MHRILVLLTAATAFAADGAFTLDEVMSRPFATELTAGPGGRVAWLVNSRGVRNIYVAEPPDYHGRRLTDFKEDDGQDMGMLQWLPGGKAVLFVRGGDLEFPRTPHPNPLSRAEGVDQSVWIAPLAGGARRLAEGRAVAPQDSTHVIFVKGNQLWSGGIADGDKPEMLAQPRGTIEDLTLAPDASAVAFTSSRQNHGLIGVYDFGSKTVRYLDPSVDTDLSPVWSPDSKSIAFVRIAASLGQRIAPARTAAEPWSIRVAGVRTGSGREVWKAAAGPGSAFHSLTSRSLFWAGGRLVFAWEKDGWAHLYSIPAEGGEAAILTPGPFEVEHAALTPDGRSLLYSSNQDDSERRHLWRVTIQPGAKPSAVTAGSGIEWSPAPLEGGAIAFLRSDARQPARAAVQSAGTARDLVPDLTPPEFPAASLIEPRPVTFPAADGMQIHGQLFVPRGNARRHPAIIFFHGGSRRQMLLGWHPMYYYNNAYALNQYLASIGYLVLSVNYRSGIGYGLDFREAVNFGPFGASEYNDVIGAGLYLRGRTDVEPDRIGLWGGSYGGYLTALGLARGSDLFAAGVDFHGVHDWSKLRQFEPGSPEARTAFEASPLASVKTWRSPVLLIHGDDDRNVPFSETVRLVEALRAQKVPFEELIFPDEIHDFLAYRHWVEAYRATADFLTRTLK